MPRTIRWSLFVLASLTSFAQSPVPLAKVTGPIPITATSKPFGAIKDNAEPFNLAKAGYVEEEYILTGTANVYDWAADGSLSIKTPNAPYGTRVLIRRPAQAAKFNGTVVVELINIARKLDWPMTWGYIGDHILDSGSAWLQITMPTNVEGLKKFNPARYADLGFANPNPACAGPIEEGLRWDAISQVAAALKNNGSMTGGAPVLRTFMEAQNADIDAYIDAIHNQAHLANGKHPYDGYMVRGPAAPTAISHCAVALTANDPRRMLKDIDVPVIGVAAQGDMAGTFPQRRADTDHYRLWEVAVASHIDRNSYRGMPSLAEQTAAVGASQGTAQWPFAARCEPEIVLQDLPLLGYVYDGALTALDKWVKDGTPAAHAPRIDTDGKTTKVNEYGIASGGIRSPYSDLPTASYTTSSNGGGSCRELGSSTPLSWNKLEQLYGSQKAYAQKAGPAIDKMLKDGFVTAADAQRMRLDLGVTK